MPDRPMLIQGPDRVMLDWDPTDETEVWLQAYRSTRPEDAGFIIVDSCGGPLALTPDDATGFAVALRRLVARTLADAPVKENDH